MKYVENQKKNYVIIPLSKEKKRKLGLQFDASESVSSLFMIFGENDLGETLLTLLIAAKYRIKFPTATIYLDCKQLRYSHARLDGILDELKNVVLEAFICQPSLLNLTITQC